MKKVKLSGFCRKDFEIGFHNESVEGFIVQIDGKSYASYVDPDDGYRSYGVFFETDEKCTNIFPPQDVLLDIIEDNGGDNWCEEPQCKLWRILNPETKEVILECGTVWYDSYYPMGRCYFDPTKMPINK